MCHVGMIKPSLPTLPTFPTYPLTYLTYLIYLTYLPNLFKSPDTEQHTLPLRLRRDIHCNIAILQWIFFKCRSMRKIMGRGRFLNFSVDLCQIFLVFSAKSTHICSICLFIYFIILSQLCLSAVNCRCRCDSPDPWNKDNFNLPNTRR
jgi:hypothetical protein